MYLLTAKPPSASLSLWHSMQVSVKRPFVTASNSAAVGGRVGTAGVAAGRAEAACGAWRGACGAAAAAGCGAVGGACSAADRI